MKIIFGLGNPGRKYERTRHNIGFQVLDILAERWGRTFAPHKFRALAAQTRIGDEPVLLVKPLTYMNLSGEAVGPIVRFYKVPLEHILVVYDDMDLPLGTLRLRAKGGSGGHKGIRSIIQHLHSEAFPRLRVGIGRPPGRMDPADFVLSPFTPEEEETMALVREKAADAVELWLREGTEKAMNRVNANAL
ncbi:MAG: aminoacyl-tRNA hydrolase [Chloroflexi bacterium]|nr:aminoacyl-tRNA hydrolase [Chloroflexota bacterium]